MAGRRLRSEDYTVGWVCALPIELAAAQEMLDEEYENLDVANDTNIYTLGRIGEHNVVIACLPAGQTGTNSAAAVAVEMKLTFPSIRFGLMVGIGGGVPSEEVDIRLGDVVVGMPNKVYSGVVQYEFGKATPSGFERTGILNAPPTILLDAVANLRANHVRGRGRLLEYFSKLDSFPTFARENAGPDILFEADYNHMEGRTCGKCSKERVVARQPRRQEVVVHYGIIASGSHVIRDAAQRDRVSAELGGVLCFEIEAAGLMNSFPCLVIRGICDYADSHKNRMWQGYAAGTAAACAKEVLSVIPIAEVAKLRTTDKIIKEENVLDSALNLLPYAKNAPFNSYASQHEPTCLHNTRVDVLQEIHNWADSQDNRCIFWLSGLVGTGKSTIARTVAREYYSQNRLGASFFFSRGDGDVGRASKFVTSIAVQLAKEIPTLRGHICEAIELNSDIANQSLRDQWIKLVLNPLSKLNVNPNPLSYILVIDALNECENENHIQNLLQLLAEVRSLQTVRLRLFLTSRPEIPIRHGFYQIPDAEHQDFVLHNISRLIVDHDIYVFFEHNFKITRQKLGLPTNWPGNQATGLLVQKAAGVFLWAATACRFIREGRRLAPRRLSLLLQGSNSLIGPEKQLNDIYLAVLENSIGHNLDEQEQRELCEILRVTLGTIIILYSPLSTSSLARLLRMPKEDVYEILRDLHSILDTPKDQAQPIRLHHPSFRDFLLGKERCTNLQFWVDEKKAHGDLADYCLRLMSENLRRDICGLGSPGTLAAEVQCDLVQQCLPTELQYACMYWVQHIQKSGTQLQDYGKVHVFLQKYLLYWLEGLSLIGKTSEGILAIISLESMVTSDISPGLHSFIEDAKRFAQYNRSVIEEAPLQIYSSALVFAPESSIVRRQFSDQVPGWIHILPEVQDDWSCLVQTFKGHSGSVWAVVFSPDGRLVASASDDRTVTLWDSATGAALRTLKGHSDSVNAVAFSPNGKQVASASSDKTIRLWDSATGAALRTLKGHSDSVNAVAFSPDGRLVASASSDKTLRLWDSATGAALRTLKGHSDSVNAVAFSPDGKQVASASSDKTIRLWDSATGAALRTLKGHSDSVSAVAFSPDGRLASASDDRTVKLWDSATGAARVTIEGHLDLVNAIAFSPDCRLVASASDDRMVRLWDSATGAARLIEGHLDFVNAIAFSPDGQLLVSASHDGKVRLLDPTNPNLMIPVEATALTQFGMERQPLRPRSHSDLISIVDPGSDSGYGTASDGSSLSSLNIPPGTEDYLVDILLGDTELMSTCQFALARVQSDRFESNFTTLLKICSRDMRQEAQTRVQKGASRVLKTYSAYAAHHVRQHFHPDKSVRAEMMKRAANQPVVKEQLMRLLQQPDVQVTGLRDDTSTPNMNDPSVGNGADENLDDIDTDEDVEPDFTVLDELKDSILTSQAFQKMRRSLALWVDSPKQSDRQSGPRKALSETQENEPPTTFQSSQTSQDQHSAPTQVKEEGSNNDEIRDSSSVSAEVEQNAQRSLFLSLIISCWVSIRSVDLPFPVDILVTGFKVFTHSIILFCSWMERSFGFAEPPIRKDTIRLKWICSCSQDFYYDFPAAFSADVFELKQMLLCSGYKAAVYAAHHSRPSRGSIPSDIRAGQEVSRSDLTWSVLGTSARHETRSVGTKVILASVDSSATHAGQRNGSQPSTPTDRWLLFCLPSYGYVHKAVHIEVPLPISDQKLFETLRKEYSKMTGPLKRIFGWKQVKRISFVQFHLRLDLRLNDNVAVLSAEWHPPAGWTEKHYWDPCPEEKPPSLAKFAEVWLLHQWKHPHERLAFRIWMAAKLSIKKAVRKTMSSISRIGTQSTKNNHHSLEHSMMELPVHSRVLTFRQTGEADEERVDSERLLEKMKGDDDEPACGWGVAVELGFELPFYLEFLALFATSSLIFGILAWCLIQLRSKGYAVFGVWSALIGTLGFCFTVIKVYAN